MESCFLMAWVLAIPGIAWSQVADTICDGGPIITDAPVALPNLMQVMWATVSRVNKTVVLETIKEGITAYKISDTKRPTSLSSSYEGVCAIRVTS